MLNQVKSLRFVFLLLAGFCGLFLFLGFWGWSLKPELAVEEIALSPEAAAEIEALRDNALTPDNPPVVYREVDYSEGPAASWYPKGESPILAELVAEGALPPVEERVGPEPLVLEGVEGIGKYGGDWFQIDISLRGIDTIKNRLSYATLLRWSPQGYPIVPHIAKSYEVKDDYREFIFHLRKGMKWSDGHPFSADDILYWWKYEENDPDRRDDVPLARLMLHRGKLGEVEKIDDYTVRFSFDDTYATFPEMVASGKSMDMLTLPAHYMSQYHPTIGNQALIKKKVNARKMPSSRALYFDLTDRWNHPDKPTLWPWIYRTYKENPPQFFVRNPYYFAVDTEGNQLPYLDRMVFSVKSPQFVAQAAASGEATMQTKHLRFKDYTLLMSQREENGYEVYHWDIGYGSSFIIAPNLNRKIDPEKPETKNKHDLINQKEFRQALSLAINRQAIIQSEYNGQAEAVQAVPGPNSLFYEPSLYYAFTEYDPERANALLDSIGLTHYDGEGMRTFKDGTRMTLFLDVPTGKNMGIAQALVRDWKNVGLRIIARERSYRLSMIERAGMVSDLRVTSTAGQIYPMVEPRTIAPVMQQDYAMAYWNWFLQQGFYGADVAEKPGVKAPPEDHPLRRAIEYYDAALTSPDIKDQVKYLDKAMKIAAENLWTINVTSFPPVLVVKDKDLRNVPHTAISGSVFQTPGNTGMETFYFEHPENSPEKAASIKTALVKPTFRDEEITGTASNAGMGRYVGRLIRTIIYISLAACLLLIGYRHPYIGKRLIIMIPTLAIVSVLSFIIIQLPPGDYLTSYVAQLEATGDTANNERLAETRKMFSLDKPMTYRYFRWIGLNWFLTFEDSDRGLLQGNMGRSMETLGSVNDLVGDRLLLTVLISMGTILFTWAVALPIGIYSAVKQYSMGDYVVTFIGFIGLCIPNFLFALLLMYFSARYLGINVSGLFSAEYASQPHWSWGKVADLMKHIWVPVVVIGTAGTASMIRVMRGNLLDELKKPYTVTARAKGVRPLRLLMKYPVRLALNPFVSGIGAIFPQLVSGGAIVAIVLSIPTVGPLMLQSLLSEDMYLAGSMLIVLSLLSVMGTLVSDLLLLMLDPRIRLEGSKR